MLNVTWYVLDNIFEYNWKWLKYMLKVMLKCCLGEMCWALAIKKEEKRLSSNRGTELFSIQHMKVITINEDQVSYAYWRIRLNALEKYKKWIWVPISRKWQQRRKSREYKWSENETNNSPTHISKIIGCRGF